MPKKTFKKKGSIEKIASTRINTLFSEAQQRPSFSSRYIFLIRRIAAKCKIPLPIHIKRRICKKCNALLTSDTMRVRISKTTVRTTCLSCEHITRIPKKP